MLVNKIIEFVKFKVMKWLNFCMKYIHFPPSESPSESKQP